MALCVLTFQETFTKQTERDWLIVCKAVFEFERQASNAIIKIQPRIFQEAQQRVPQLIQAKSTLTSLINEDYSALYQHAS